MCVCCIIFCFLFWWNLDKFIGFVGLLVVYCWLIDSCDIVIDECLLNFDDVFSVFCCYGIMNCVSVCLKGLNLMKVIGYIKFMLINCLV